MSKIRVAIVGVGNCASSLVQGVTYYGDKPRARFSAGLLHENLGGYRIRDIVFSAAFDVNRTKVGRDLAEAIFASPNNAKPFAAVPSLGVEVQRGPTLDGLGIYVSRLVKESREREADVADALRRTRTDVVVNFLPVGSERATAWYAEKVIAAGCAFVNGIPVFIASDPSWQSRFRRAGLPVIGDDVKSQVGATILHRELVNLFLDRGLPVDRTYQLNTGGNADFLNMLERGRLRSKKISKTRAVRSQFELRGVAIDPDSLHVGPSDYVPWLKDNKVCFLRIESRHFGDVPLSLECRLSVEDSPNSAGIIVDAVRCARLALDHGLGGALIGPSSYFMKSPPRQFTDERARALVETFIRRYGRSPVRRPARPKPR
jgi:myo-inositol-1-phosphate synthase